MGKIQMTVAVTPKVTWILTNMFILKCFRKQQKVLVGD